MSIEGLFGHWERAALHRDGISRLGSAMLVPDDI
jgi:hypothetical protein